MIRRRSRVLGVVAFAAIITSFLSGLDLLTSQSQMSVLAGSRPGLSFEDRVRYQQRLEEIYFRRRALSAESGKYNLNFEHAVSATEIREKVADALRKSNALDRYWDHEITGEQLQFEIERMATQTRQPGLLVELFNALNDDPYLIAECLARPILVERLLRNWYARDTRFHGDLRTRAEAELSRHQSLDAMRDTTGAFSVIESIKVDRISPQSQESGLASDTSSSPAVREVPSTEWDSLNSRLDKIFLGLRPCQECSIPGSPVDLPTQLFSNLQEDHDRFYAVAVVSQSERSLKLAVVEWAKTPFDHWWSNEKSGLSTSVHETPYTFQIGMVKSPQSTCSDDSWRPTKALPEGTTGHTAVWTGVEMIVWGGVSNFGGKTNTGAKYNPATDVWTRISAIEAPDPRGNHTAIWTGTEMIIWGGCTQLTSFCAVNTGGRYNPATDSWTPISLTNAPSPRTRHRAVWTGSKMIVWGGCRPEYDNSNCTSHMTATGGQYDPATDTWTATSLVNAPSARVDHTAVWTGTEMIIWGGYFALNTGGRYNPATNTWTPTGTANVPEGRRNHTAVWSGTEMIVWGGFNGTSSALNTGGRYNPSSDSWIATSVTNAPSPRGYHTAVWTGTAMIVWGGSSSLGGINTLNTGGRYDPTSNSWVPTSTTNAPSPRAGHTAVWTGSLMIIWGARYDKTGGRYNPSTDSWQPTDTNDSPQQLYNHIAVWTGAEMIVWGESGEGIYAMVGSRYNPAMSSWQSLSTVNRPEVRDRGFTAVWTGTEMIVWGGQYGSSITNTGGRYNPTTDTWIATSVAGAPSARADHSAIWTGTEMIIWGGTDGTRLNSGGRYNPSTDTWTATSTVGAPDARYIHTGVWTGSEMIIWGGFGDAGHVNTGGRYNPSTNTWQVTNTVGAPEPRRSHSAVWTGTEMIIWGGTAGDYNSACCLFNNGGRYNPATNAWTPVSTTGAPSARFGHTSIWTGSEIIIWGGRVAGTTYIEGTHTGGRYKPSTDSWRPTSILAAPSKREGHTAVWTGSDMIVWGGIGSEVGAYTTSGGHYCVAAGCSYSTAPTSEFFSVEGGEGVVNVWVAGGCSWNVVCDYEWITVTSETSGRGNGAVTYIVRENFTRSARQGIITVGGHAFTIVQDGGLGSDCTYLISAQFVSIKGQGGAGSFSVFSESRCAWKATSSAAWIVVTSGSIGIGNGTVGYTVAANPSSTGRKGVITVGGKTFAVKQKGM